MNRYKCPACGGDQYSASPNRAHEPCIYCGNKGAELMKNLEPENDEDSIKRIGKEQASEVIETRTPTGLFYTKENGLFIGIDNSLQMASRRMRQRRTWTTAQLTSRAGEEEPDGQNRSDERNRKDAAVLRTAGAWRN